MTRKIVNGRIVSTRLGIEAHGCLVFSLFIKHQEGEQAFGAHILADGGEQAGASSAFLIPLLAAAGRSSWESLDGADIRVDFDAEKIHRIGHIMEDRWFDWAAWSRSAFSAPIKPQARQVFIRFLQALLRANKARAIWSDEAMEYLGGPATTAKLLRDLLPRVST
jgi:hypothetical protein